MKRLTLFLGHYGSGKTNLAVNWAMNMAKSGKSVEIADLDIVNPYFRTKDSQKELEAAGVKVIALPFANSSVDLPSIPSEAYALVEDKSRYGVLDIGGDERGAYALGRFSPYIREEDNYDMFYVVNLNLMGVEILGVIYNFYLMNTNVYPNSFQEYLSRLSYSLKSSVFHLIFL